MHSGIFAIDRGQNSVNTLTPSRSHFVFAYVMGAADTRVLDVGLLRETRPNVNCLHFSSTSQFLMRLWDGVSFTGYSANTDMLAIPKHIKEIQLLSIDPATIAIEAWAFNGPIGDVLRGGYSEGFSNGFDVLYVEE